jgi:hypothetical protein
MIKGYLWGKESALGRVEREGKSEVASSLDTEQRSVRQGLGDMGKISYHNMFDVF